MVRGVTMENALLDTKHIVAAREKTMGINLVMVHGAGMKKEIQNVLPDLLQQVNWPRKLFSKLNFF